MSGSIGQKLKQKFSAKVSRRERDEPNYIQKAKVIALLNNIQLKHLPGPEPISATMLCCTLCALCLSPRLGQLQEFNSEAHQLELIRSCLAPLPISVGSSRTTPHPNVFVVLAYQRTGSNLLCGQLHNHPRLLMHNEVFNDVRCFSYLEIESDPSWMAVGHLLSGPGPGGLHQRPHPLPTGCRIRKRPFQVVESPGHRAQVVP